MSVKRIQLPGEEGIYEEQEEGRRIPQDSLKSAMNKVRTFLQDTSISESTLQTPPI